MDLKSWRNQIIQEERLHGGKKLVDHRRAYNQALHGGNKIREGCQTYDVDKKGLASFVNDNQNGIIMVYASWCPASLAYKQYFEQEKDDLPIIMYDVASQPSIDCNCNGRSCTCVGSKRFGAPLSEGVKYYPTIFFVDGERSLNFNVPEKDKESVKKEYKQFKTPGNPE
jgi:hypothetical protein